MNKVSFDKAYRSSYHEVIDYNMIHLSFFFGQLHKKKDQHVYFPDIIKKLHLEKSCIAPISLPPGCIYYSN